MSEKTPNYDALLKALKRLPSEVLNVSGRFLYSSHQTLVPGRYYLIGYNPGWDRNTNPLLSKELKTWREYESNVYLDEEWSDKRTTYAKGEHPMQTRVIKLFEELRRRLDKDSRAIPPIGKPNHPVRSVCASNWFFPRASGAEELKTKGFSWETFKDVHEEIIRIVMPEFIFAIGGETFEVIYRAFSDFQEEDGIDSGTKNSHGSNIICRVAERSYGQIRQKLIGLPHLRRFNLHDNVITEIVKRYSN